MNKLNKPQSFAQSSSRSIIMKLRSRVHKILDQQFSFWVQKIQKEKHFDSVTINESVLEDWVQMFKNQVLIGKSKTSKDKNFSQQGIMKIKEKQQLKRINFFKPFFQKSDNHKVMIHRKNQDTINVYQPKFYYKKCQWQSTSYQIPEKKLKPFSSITYSSISNSLIIIGGHKPSNPNIKSSKISKLCLESSTFTQISNLPYGLSSHATVSQSSNIYIIGGNKNHSILTRGCFKFNEMQNRLEQISCLNYPVANANCILWKEKWIYKFGGIGEAFGTWDNSPYIERYSMNDNFWQVINPVMNEGQQIFSQIFFANSNSYICAQENKIFVFGGYDINGKYKRTGFTLNIEEKEDQQTAQHKIQQYGFVQCNEIIANNFVFVHKKQAHVQMYGLNRNYDDQSMEKPSLVYEFS